MKASWACAVAASLLLAASAVNAQVTTYQKNNLDKILYGVEAPFSESGAIKVYLDPDNNGGTGHKYHGIGADFKVEDDGVYAWQDGAWEMVGPATVTRTTITKGGEEYTQWEAIISRALIGETEHCDEQTSLVYDVYGTPGERNVHRFTNLGRCWTPAEHTIGSTLDEFIFEIKSLAEWNKARVYIDADKNPTTGFSVDEGWTGAEYLLEEDKLYQRVGGSWVVKADIFFDYNGDWGVWTWRIARADIGDVNACVTQVSAAFEGTYGGVGGWIQSTTSRVSSYTDCFPLTVAAPASADICQGADCGFQNLDAAGSQLVGGYAVVTTAAPVRDVRDMQADGLKVLGLVNVDMGRRALDEVRAEISALRARYLTMNGVMFNNMYSNDCKQIGYMVALKIHVRNTMGPNSVVAANPGVIPPGCYMDSVDVMMTFDGTYDAYMAEPPKDEWVYNFPSSKFMHAISVSNNEQVAEVVAQGAVRHAANLIVYTQGTDKWAASQPRLGSTTVFTAPGEINVAFRRLRRRHARL